MEWIGHVGRENTIFMIGARTEAFNAATGLVLAPVFDGDQNKIYIPYLGFWV